MSRTIPLTRGLVAIVDDADYDKLICSKWQAAKRNSSYYAVTHISRSKGRGVIYMHRFIVSAKRGQQVDHINHDGLDNRRENLRICSSSENGMNQRKTRGTSQYKGVSLYHDGKWRAKIKKHGYQHSLGHYVNEEDAARAYDRAAVKLFGEFACLNFPEEHG